MARKKSKQSGVGHKDLLGQQSVSKSPVSPGAAAGGGDAALERPARTSQAMHTCCLLCHREFKDWGAGLANGLPGHAPKLADTVPALSQASGRKLGDAVPSLSQSLLGEVPLWICQSCRKSVEEEERRTAQEQCGPVPMSHSSSCKSQSCGNGYPEQNSVDWDPSSFLSARKLSGLWSSAHTNTGAHCTHSAASHAQQAGGPAGPTCHDKRSPHEASGTRVCPYSHAAPSPGLGATPLATPTATPLPADLCKTTPKHFKTMCRRPTPPGEAFHPGEQHPPADLSVPPNSPTGLSSQSPALLPLAKPSPGQHAHSPASPHSPFSTLAPSLAPGSAPAGKHSAAADGPGSLHKPGACKNAHGPPAAGPQHGKLGTSLMGCTHPCNGHNSSGGGGVAASTTSTTAHLTASTCRDQACKGHKLANGSACQQGACEQDEGEDEDSSSERSSCASSSTNQRDGKYCDCCYCEFFGHNAPPAAPTSRNYAEIREKLRSRLTRRKEELPQRQEADPAAPGAVDHRDVDELLDFINSTEPKPVNSAKAAKRARHKQKKKEKERALQGVSETACGERRSSSPPEPAEEEEDPVPDGEPGRLLEWPQLELERVNSFLTSRLEEIKNTIKDSIRASFSMYDLNLDVNDFPKKAATLEGNHLLSHLNGSSDLQHVDLDLAPLSLRSFKRDLEIVNGWGEEGPATGPAHAPPPATKAVQRLHSTPSLSKVIRVRSPERSSPPGSETAPPGPAPPAPKPKDEASDGKNATGPGAKTKKTKKQQQRQQQDPAPHDQPAASRKATPGSQEKTQEVRPAEPEKPSRGGARSGPQNHPHESLRVSGRKAEDGKASKHSANGAPNGNHHSGPGTNRGKGDADARGSRTDHEVEGRNVSNSPANTNLQQQPKGKTKKSRSKTEKSSNAIDDVFLPKDLDPTEMDEIDREVEHFKRFCLDSAKQTRQKVAVNWSNFSLKKMPSNAAQ